MWEHSDTKLLFLLKNQQKMWNYHASVILKFIYSTCICRFIMKLCERYVDLKKQWSCLRFSLNVVGSCSFFRNFLIQFLFKFLLKKGFAWFNATSVARHTKKTLYTVRKLWLEKRINQAIFIKSIFNYYLYYWTIHRFKQRCCMLTVFLECGSSCYFLFKFL